MLVWEAVRDALAAANTLLDRHQPPGRRPPPPFDLGWMGRPPPLFRGRGDHHAGRGTWPSDPRVAFGVESNGLHISGRGTVERGPAGEDFAALVANYGGKYDYKPQSDLFYKVSAGGRHRPQHVVDGGLREFADPIPVREMKPINTITGSLAPLPRANVDTDQIMPKKYLKRVERTGYGEFVFAEWKAADPDFVLNRPEYRQAKILVTGPNFGSGSSREHAPWGLQDWGFEAIVAPSFADIFRVNCTKIGLLPVELHDKEVTWLMELAEADPAAEVVIDLPAQTVSAHDGSARAQLRGQVPDGQLHQVAARERPRRHRPDLAAHRSDRRVRTLRPATSAPFSAEQVWIALGDRHCLGKGQAKHRPVRLAPIGEVPAHHHCQLPGEGQTQAGRVGAIVVACVRGEQFSS